MCGGVPNRNHQLRFSGASASVGVGVITDPSMHEITSNPTTSQPASLHPHRTVVGIAEVTQVVHALVTYPDVPFPLVLPGQLEVPVTKRQCAPACHLCAQTTPSSQPAQSVAAATRASSSPSATAEMRSVLVAATGPRGRLVCGMVQLCSTQSLRQAA